MTADPRKAATNPARGWVAMVPDDGTVPYVGFDLTISESHTSEAEITTHPVEVGTDVTDNIRQQPLGFECVVYVSNTPVLPPNVGSTPANVTGLTAANDIAIPMPPQALVTPPGAPLFTPGGLWEAAQAGILAAATALGLATDTSVTQFSPTQFAGGVFDAIRSTYDLLVDLQSRGITMSVFTSIEEYDGMALASVSLPRDHFGGAEITLGFKQILTAQTSTTAAPVPVPPAGNPPVTKGAQATTAASPPPTVTSIAQSLLGIGH